MKEGSIGDTAATRRQGQDGTPAAIIAMINAEVRALFAEQAFIDRVITPNTFEPMVSSPEAFADFIKRDSAKWAAVLREANIKVD